MFSKTSMIDGVKVSLVYHLYCKDVETIAVGTGNVYNEINRRCLEHFHDVFDDAVFCVCVDDRTDSELIQKAVAWIWSCGFKDNVIIKVKPNSPYRDAQTFYDEVATHLTEFDGMVFFAHNKGGTYGDCLGIRQWVVFSYFACLDNISRRVKNLAECNVAQTYVLLKNNEQEYKYGWLNPGGIYLFHPRKLWVYLNENGKSIPLFHDRYYAESFLASIFDLSTVNYYKYGICFDDECLNYYSESADLYQMNHLNLISVFLSNKRTAEYQSFYDQITKGL